MRSWGEQAWHVSLGAEGQWENGFGWLPTLLPLYLLGQSLPLNTACALSTGPPSIAVKSFWETLRCTQKQLIWFDHSLILQLPVLSGLKAIVLDVFPAEPSTILNNSTSEVLPSPTKRVSNPSASRGLWCYSEKRADLCFLSLALGRLILRPTVCQSGKRFLCCLSPSKSLKDLIKSPEPLLSIEGVPLL